MSRCILGLSAYFHDSAAAILVDGEIVAAAQEERFSRKKHDAAFPFRAVEYCLREAGIGPEGIDYVVFYEKPLLKFERLLETYLAFAPRGLGSFLAAMPSWLKTKLRLPREIRKALGGTGGVSGGSGGGGNGGGGGYRKRVAFARHHESHAASAFFPSPFEEAAILTMDGVGEWDTASIGHGRGNRIELLRTQEFPHSLGLLYSAFTSFAGFKVNGGEYKLMGLAPYGEPRYVDLILEKIVDLKEDGSLALDLGYFNYCEGMRMTNGRFAALFGGPARAPESEITQREMDLACSIQKVTELAVLRMARTARELTRSTKVCLAGGVAMNCVANGVLLRSGIFDEVWVAPCSGDAGAALGAALFLHHQLLEGPRRMQGASFEVGAGNADDDAMRGAFLGPRFSNEEIGAFLAAHGIPHRRIEDEAELLREVAAAIAEEKVVGWFQGRMEFGPRALGARSILGDARSDRMQSRMNRSIKRRESFRPFAPSVLAEDAATYFEIDRESPYMQFVVKVARGQWCEGALSEEQEDAESDLLKRVQVKRSTIPAATHVDMSARVQTVDEARNGRFYRLIREFKRQTGCGVVLNTSFNVRGEPVVCSPEDAYRCFVGTEMDVLVMEGCLVSKAEMNGHQKAQEAQK